MSKRNEGPEAHYKSAGLSLIAIGSTLFIMSGIMYLVEGGPGEDDHISTMLVSMTVILTGLWLRAHDATDML